MKTKKKLYSSKPFLGVVMILLTFIFTLTSCQSSPGNSQSDAEQKIQKQEFVLGTFVDIQLFQKSQSPLLEAAFKRLQDIENTMSVTIPTSQVAKINQSAGITPVAVSDDVYYVIEKSLHFSQLSKGNFDISIEPVAALWGIGGDHPKVPSEIELKPALAKVGYQKIQLDPAKKTVYLPEKGMAIDLGGIAKGFAADEIINILKKTGVKKAIVNLGGNVYAWGEKSPDHPWTVGIQDPNRERNQPVGSLKLTSKSVVTSGIYERYFEDPATKKHYHHILSPYTGFPADNSLTSVTIISASSIDADALSTSTFILGLEEGLKFAESQDSIEAIFITRDKKVYITPGLKDNFKLLENDFTLEN